MKDYTFTTEVMHIEAGKCRLMIPLSVSKKFPKDVWAIYSLKVNGNILKNKSLSKNMGKYFYILVNDSDVGDRKYADIELKV